MTFHKDLTLDNNHALTARFYADIATRDADTGFQVSTNINKIVRVEAPSPAYYVLVSIGPAVWVEFSSVTAADTLPEVLANGNTTGPNDIIVDAGQVVTLTDAPVAGTDATNKTYVDAQVGANNELSEILANGNTSGGTEIDMENVKIVNVLDPTVNQDAATKNYVDTQVGANNELSEILANGNISGPRDIRMDIGQGIVIGGGSMLSTDTSLDLADTDKAQLPNRLTTTQRDALIPLDGMIIYNTTTQQGEQYNGTIWMSTHDAGG